jgi:hypothetical protein
VEHRYSGLDGALSAHEKSPARWPGQMGFPLPSFSYCNVLGAVLGVLREKGDGAPGARQASCVFLAGNGFHIFSTERALKLLTAIGVRHDYAQRIALAGAQ